MDRNGNGRKADDMTRDERIAAAREAAIRMVGDALKGCNTPEHKAVEVAAETILSETFVLDVLPGKVKDAVVRYYVHDALHHDVMEAPQGIAGLIGAAEPIPDFARMYARLGDRNAVLRCLNVAVAVLMTCGIDLQDPTLTRGANPPTTGVYL